MRAQQFEQCCAQRGAQVRSASEYVAQRANHVFRMIGLRGFRGADFCYELGDQGDLFAVFLKMVL